LLREATSDEAIQEDMNSIKQPAVYIMANQKNGTLYTGVTSNLVKRVYEHKNSITQGFTSKYTCKLLVFYEILETMENAINREKQIKGGSRNRKLKLIEAKNPEWRNLYEEII
jgi:putative endonuclease